LKATYGRVSRAGILPHTWSLDHAGPLTRCVEDAALTLSVIAGSDPRDSTSADVPVGDYLSHLKNGVRGIRIGVPREHFWERIQERVEPVVRQALYDLEAAGAQVEEVSIEAQRLRRVLIEEVRTALNRVDVLATPALPLCAWEISQSHVEIAGQTEHVLHACWRFTYPWNLTGLPALSVPCGFVGGLPVGLQLVGRPFDEAMVLRVGHAYETITRWHKTRPPEPSRPPLVTGS
jgi:aspartyl-tRNA(Asn)/glutamyl-tRNA(Gln) amidotransferase subunit A